MTMLEYYLVAIFSAVWIVPLAMAVAWERRLRTSQRAPQQVTRPQAERVPVA
jgi:hypothetical protein